MLRICLLLLLSALPAAAQSVSGSARVGDGDTLTVAGERIRLFGIDAPELDQSCQRADGTSWDCGRWSKAELERLVRGRRVACQGRERDRYGRLVATCRVGGTDLGAAMVSGGAAFAYRQFSLDYVDAEKEAVFAGRGVWQGEAEDPADVRAGMREAAPRPAEASNAGDCRIKGNISGSGRIYHMPGQADYAATRIDTSRGERWFCTEAEARAAGWRPARR